MGLIKSLVTFLIFVVATDCSSQPQMIFSSLTSKLDSITTENGKEKHFGQLYLQTTILVEDYIEGLPEKGRVLMKRLEERFAVYFFDAINASNNEKEIPGVWRTYFNGDHSPLQLKLIGANAHINGDLWQALTNNFSLTELYELKPFYKKYGLTLCKEFDELFELGRRSDNRLRNLHFISLGLDRFYGKLMLKRWRNRQIRLAILKYEKPITFTSRKNRIDKKRQRIDKMITYYLNAKA